MIEIVDVVKRYGHTYAIGGINLKIDKGSFVGLIGPNGSGKTTLLKLVFGYERPSSGYIHINGESPSTMTNSFITYYPEVESLYSGMKVSQLLGWYSEFFLDWDKEKEKKLIQFFDLPLQKYIYQLSKGFRTRLKLILTLARNAKLFLLDEPLSGIDPTSRDRIVSAVLNEYREDRTFILATHIVSEAETLFDRTIFLLDGNIVIDGESDDLRSKYGKSIDAIFKEELNA